MKARFAPLLSRLSVVSVIAVSALGAAACSRASTTADPAVDQAAQAESTQEATPGAAQRGPGHQIFAQVAALDLRDDQRAAVSEIEQNLAADMAPHGETLRQVAQLLADSIERGQIEPADAAAQQAALAASVLDAKASFTGAMNDVHDVLDADQRAALVAQLQEQRERYQARGAEAEHPHGPIAKLALELGLGEEQKAALRDEVRKHVEAIFPDRKAHRLESEARMQAMADAFVTDSFDAADFDLGGGAEQALQSFSTIAAHAVDVSGRVLSAPQRQALAALIRARAADHI
jgi:Spy/CpxP family protein refolding chaperone